MRVLVDTSVWIDHLRRGNRTLTGELRRGAVLRHDFVIGELACGNLRNRAQVLGLLRALPAAGRADHQDVLLLLDRHQLYGRGLGWVDAHLLASARLTGCRLWTRDRALDAAAELLGVWRE